MKAQRCVQDVLLHLVSLEPRELCSEAIIEKCRATRDLRSCGRIVQHALTSCGHASLCAECCQRCDVCPICRLPIGRFSEEPMMHMRLYEECVQAGLIHHRDEEFWERDGHRSQDVQHLWSFFEIALDNNLVSVITDYVSDVCLDDDAVSSDAVVSILMDGIIVKEWCSKVFAQIVRSLQEIYSLGARLMKSKVGILEKLLTKLNGLSRVLETLETPSDVPIVELRRLVEGVRRVSQHLEVMCWCARFGFLEVIPSHHSTINNWRAAVRGRKLAANSRAWPEHRNNAFETLSCHSATLFIEDAMTNVGYGKDNDDDPFLELGGLRIASATPSGTYRRRETGVTLHGTTTVYPPESLHAAVDAIFLEASSDLFLAKKAIFLYYLFDRQWPQSGGDWKAILDDYVYTFEIPRHVMLESLLFFLLDDINEAALEEACRLLPEIVTSKLHPKVSHVLLERHKPDIALEVLRCTGQDNWLQFSDQRGKSNIPSLSDAVNAVRVRIECGLLTEAYLYQRSYASSVKAQIQKSKMKEVNATDPRDWLREVELLVGELCWLCICKNTVDKMIELPWQAEEESIVLRWLLEHASQDPCSPAGSLMVVFYIMRCRHREAYLVHKRLCALEKKFLDHCLDEEKRVRINTASAQRAVLVEKGVELLPCIVREQLQTDAVVDILPLLDEPFLHPMKGSEEVQAVPWTGSALADFSAKVVSQKASVDLKCQAGYEDLQDKPLKASPGGTCRVVSQINYTPFNGFPSQESNRDGLFSPILGRRLIYNDDHTQLMRKASSNPYLQLDHLTQHVYKHATPESTDYLHAGVQRQSNDYSGSMPLSGLSRVLVDEEMQEMAHVNHRTQSGGLLPTGNGLSIRSTSTPLQSAYRQPQDDALKPREVLREEEHVASPSRSESASLCRTRRQMLHSSPNGKRKAYDPPDVSQLDSALELQWDFSSSIFSNNGSKQSGNVMKQGTSIERESTLANSDRKSGLRWRSEDDDIIESTALYTQKKSSSSLKKAISGNRLLRSHAL